MGDGVADVLTTIIAWLPGIQFPGDHDISPRLAGGAADVRPTTWLARRRGEFGTENVEAELAGALNTTERELRLERTRADGS